MNVTKSHLQSQITELRKESDRLRQSRRKIGERRHALARANEVLQGQVGGLKDAVEVLDDENERLRSKLNKCKGLLKEFCVTEAKAKNVVSKYGRKAHDMSHQLLCTLESTKAA